MDDEPKKTEGVPAWQSEWRMTEAVMPERPIDRGWARRLALRTLAVIVIVALGTVVSAFCWSAAWIILVWLLGGFSERH